MLTPRFAQERGHADHGWLKTFHTFSFADYYDPKFVGFRDLVVINEDYVQEGTGFGKHGHKNMEIITYVIEGAVEHKDSMGTGSVIRPGDVQRMSAGRGVMHSEFNPSSSEALHLLQIWIKPNQENIEPSYEEKKFSLEQKHNRLCLLVSPNGVDNSLRMQQNAFVYGCVLDAEKPVVHELHADRHAWIQIVHGKINLQKLQLGAGDGVAISNERQLEIKSEQNAEFLLFDLP